MSSPLIESILNLIATEYGKKFAKANRDCNQTITFRPTGGIVFTVVLLGALTLYFCPCQRHSASMYESASSTPTRE